MIDMTLEKYLELFPNAACLWPRRQGMGGWEPEPLRPESPHEFKKSSPHQSIALYIANPEEYEKRNKNIIEMRAAGQTYTAIGEATKITRERVRQIVKREERRQRLVDRHAMIDMTLAEIMGAVERNQFPEELQDAESAYDLCVAISTKTELNICVQLYDEKIDKNGEYRNYFLTPKAAKAMAWLLNDACNIIENIAKTSRDTAGLSERASAKK